LRSSRPAGGTREERWTNTNQLLGTEGFSGVKTGTTRLAGACLVSAGERGDHRLLVVVLGSAASPVRYVDSRNLYRFAWLQLGHEPVVE
jgi:serine-type D-Ala-D-Ala carboxypeptidase (penicillin-binding protein 5/6)